MRFRILEDDTHTLARLLFAPPTLPEAVRRIDTIEAARAFQISISAVLHHFDQKVDPSCDMYRFWMDGGWQNGDWEDDENDRLCPVAFLVGILFDRGWIRKNFECDGGRSPDNRFPGISGKNPEWVPTPSQRIALENPWEMIDLILNPIEEIQCDAACLGLTFVYTWWYERGGGAQKKWLSEKPSGKPSSVFPEPA